MDKIKEICNFMIRHDIDHVETHKKHIYRTKEMWIYAEGSTPIVGNTSLEAFLDKIEELYNGCF